MENETITLEQFIKTNDIRFTCARVGNRPDGLMSQDGMRHFHCRIYKGAVHPNSSSFGLYFSQGSAHTVDPTLADVLDCLASDASGYENAKDAAQYNREKNQGSLRTEFDEWADEYGYDTDSRKAEKIYKTVKRQAEQLKRTLGAEAYEQLLWNTERL